MQENGNFGKNINVLPNNIEMYMVVILETKLEFIDIMLFVTCYL